MSEGLSTDCILFCVKLCTKDWFLDLFFRMSVRFIVSERSGCGKGLMVRRLSQPLESFLNNEIVTRQLKALGRDSPLCITVPIHGKMVDKSAVVEALNPHAVLPNIPLSRIFHLDISPSVGNSKPRQNDRRISAEGWHDLLRGRESWKYYLNCFNLLDDLNTYVSLSIRFFKKTTLADKWEESLTLIGLNHNTIGIKRLLFFCHY